MSVHSIDPDWIPNYAASDLGLNFLPFYHKSQCKIKSILSIYTMLNKGGTISYR